MVREVRTLNWCDLCFAADEHEEGTTHTISLNSRGGYAVIELCARHEAELLLPLQEVLVEHGRPARGEQAGQPVKTHGRKGTGGGYPCPVPGCNYGPYALPGGVSEHMRKKHPQPKRQTQESPQGELLPLDPFTCEVCGADFSESTRPSQALAGHRVRSHGIRKGEKASA
jgi:hypothetical protein